MTISVGNTAPTATITAPAAGTTWRVGDTIAFAGGATDAQDGALPASALSWSLVMHHCPSNCHTHPLQTFDGVAGGSFTTPDHEYPAHLELRLTARDSGGLTDTESIRLDPRTVALTLSANPGGLNLALNGATAATPFTRTVIQGSTQHDLCALATDEGEEVVGLPIVVGRRRADARRGRAEQRDDLHRHLQAALSGRGAGTGQISTSGCGGLSEARTSTGSPRSGNGISMRSKSRGTTTLSKCSRASSLTWPPE